MKRNPIISRAVRAKGGKRADLGGLYVRSSMEANVARYLNFLKHHGQVDRWEYEPCEFEFPIRRGNRFYKPDFAVWEKGAVEPVYWEVKGWMDAQSKTKLKRMAKYHGKVKIVIVDRAVYRGIEAAVGKMIPGWE